MLSFMNISYNLLREIQLINVWGLLTYWSFLTSEKCYVVATVHVRHAYVVTISPVQLPKEEKITMQVLSNI